jgi:hypothetical protein
MPSLAKNANLLKRDSNGMLMFDESVRNEVVAEAEKQALVS